MKPRFLIPIVLLVVLLGFLAVGLRHDPREIPSPLIGKPAPAFALPGLNGEPANITQDDLRGRPLLVNFFASWCAGCQVEHPILMELAKQGVEIVGMDYKDTDAEGAAWLSRHGNPYRTVVADASGGVGLDWGVYGVPETFVLDAQGVIVYKQIGPMTPDAWTEKIQPLLQKDVAPAQREPG
jgi:cytochrome c biogenesis protein CcmG/thiol:disulfide interchange protein DsbE